MRNIVPRIPGVNTLGTPEKRWGAIYADQIVLPDNKTLLEILSRQDTTIEEALGQQNLIITNRLAAQDAEIDSRLGAQESAINQLSAQKVDKENAPIKYNKAKYIFIGDSYGTGQYGDDVTGEIKINTTNWINEVIANLDLSSDQYYRSAVNGGAFYGNGFLNQLKNLEASIADKNSIDYIVVCGGINDATAAYAANDTVTGAADAIASAITNFCDYVKTKFPNAIVKIGHISWRRVDKWSGDTVADKALINQTSKKAYMECASNSNAEYLNGVELILHTYNWFSNYYHPNNDGSKKLGIGIANAIKNGHCTIAVVGSALNDFSPFPSSGVTMSSDLPYFSCYQNNNIIGIASNHFSLNFNKWDLSTYEYNNVKDVLVTTPKGVWGDASVASAEITVPIAFFVEGQSGLKYGWANIYLRPHSKTQIKMTIRVFPQVAGVVNLIYFAGGYGFVSTDLT